MKIILFISQHNSNWGAERSTCSIATHLNSLGYRVILIIPQEGKILELINEFGLEYKVHYFRGWINGNGTNYPRAIASTLINMVQLFRLRSILKKERIQPNIVYSNTLVHGFGILIAKIYHLPHIQHIRENIDVFGMKFNWGYAHTLKFINRNTNSIICTCDAIKERYIKDLTINKLQVIHNGIPVTPYKQPIVNSTIFTLVYVGRLYRDKRPQDLIQMIKRIVESDIKDIRLDIYGNGEMENELKEEVTNNNLDNFIHFKGYQQNINYSHYHIGFLPSEFEAFARTTLEYMMNGLAVIGTNTGGTIEQIEHAVTGYLYTPGNIEEMKEYALRLYNNRENCLSFGKMGYIRVVKLFSQKNYVEKLGKIFNENINK